jgi:hypothetical protein
LLRDITREDKGHCIWPKRDLTEENMIPPLLERHNNSKQMLVVAVYLSMFLDNILLTVVGEYYINHLKFNWKELLFLIFVSAK